MKVQTLYAFAGLVWGLVLGPYIGLAAARTMGNVAWLYEFQNGAWVNWAVIPFGAIVGLTVLFFCYQLGAAAGRRYDDTDGRQLRHAKAVPWALILVGITVGTITVRSIGGEQRVLIEYVQMKKDTTTRLLVLERNLHRITGLNIEWPAPGLTGNIHLLFRGKRKGDYRLDWWVRSRIAEKPFLYGSHTLRLEPKPWNTDFPINPWDIAAEYLRRQQDPQADIAVDERFTLVMQLRPNLSPEEWATLPDDEALRLDQGNSILRQQVTKEFRLRFALRDGHMVW